MTRRVERLMTRDGGEIVKNGGKIASAITQKSRYMNLGGDLGTNVYPEFAATNCVSSEKV